jgi:hypothetical protein
MVDVMTTIGLVRAVHCKSLENSTCHFTADRSLSFTNTAEPWWGTAMNPTRAQSAARFMTAAGDATGAGVDPRRREAQPQLRSCSAWVRK